MSICRSVVASFSSLGFAFLALRLAILSALFANFFPFALLRIMNNDYLINHGSRVKKHDLLRQDCYSIHARVSVFKLTEINPLSSFEEKGQVFLQVYFGHYVIRCTHFYRIREGGGSRRPPPHSFENR